MYRVKFIKPWQFYKIGQEITPGGLLKDFLVRYKYVEMVVPKQLQVDVEVAEKESVEIAGEEKTEVRVKRPRGRPRKFKLELASG